MVRFARQGDGSWKPVTVFLATRARLQGRTLPGDPERDLWLAGVLTGARPPLVADGARERGTYEDWIGWAVGDEARGWPGALGNGHDTWATEVKPELTIGQLYDREVLQIEPRALTRPDLKPTTEIAPDLLGGRKRLS
jgi:hypothetical protein